MKRYLLIGILLLSFLIIYGQENFNESFSNPFLNTGEGVGASVFEKDSSVIVISRIVEQDLSTIGLIIFYDQSGNLNSLLELDAIYDSLQLGPGRFGGGVLGSTGKLYIPFVEFEQSGPRVSNNGIFKFDLDSEQIDTIRHIVIDEFRYVFYQVRTWEDHFYACGQVNADTAEYLEPDGAHGFLMKLDTLGNQVWVRHYNNSWKIDYMDRAENGEFVLGSSDFDIGGPESTQNMVIKTDTSGIEKWRFTFGGDFEQHYTPTEFSNDGHILAIGSDANSGTLEYPLRLLKIEDQQTFGNILIDQIYYSIPGEPFNATPTSAYSILEDQEGNVYSGGYIKKWNDLGVIHAYGFLMKCSAELDSIWHRSYTHYEDSDNWHFIRDINFSEDGGFVMTGSAEEGSNSPGVPHLDHIWTLKVDSFGCLEPGCQLIDGLEEIVFGLENSMSVYPNPVQDFLNIQWSEEAGPSSASGSAQRLLVFNAIGQLVVAEDISGTSTGSVSEGITLELSDLHSGYYTLHWLIGNSWYDSVKFIKE